MESEVKTDADLTITIAMDVPNRHTYQFNVFGVFDFVNSSLVRRDTTLAPINPKKN